MRTESFRNRRSLAIAIVGLVLACSGACAARFSQSNPPRHAVAATADDSVGPTSSGTLAAQPPTAVPRPATVREEQAVEAKERDDDAETAERDDAPEADDHEER